MPRQIGWGIAEILEWQIKKIRRNGDVGTTTTTTTAIPFNPDSLAGQFVYQADISSDVIRSGSNVTSWVEKLGSGKPIPATSNPQYFASGGPNDFPYIKMTGSSDC